MCSSRGQHFHFAGGDFRIRLLPPQHAPFDRDHKFRAQLFRLGVRLGMLLLVEHDLRDSRAVAQIDKDQLAQVAPPVHPAHQHDVLVRVRAARSDPQYCVRFKLPSVSSTCSALSLFKLTECPIDVSSRRERFERPGQGRIASRGISLRVLGPPPKFLNPPTASIRHAGRSLSFESKELFRGSQLQVRHNGQL